LAPRRPFRSATRRLPGPQPPLVVTDRALDALDAILSKQLPRASQSLGLVLEPGGTIGLVIDEPGADDRGFTWKARTVLFISAEVSTRLAGNVLDFSGVSAPARFTLRPASA